MQPMPVNIGKNISDEERAMMADMPTDEEFMLIETLKLATLSERRYMALLARNIMNC